MAVGSDSSSGQKITPRNLHPGPSPGAGDETLVSARLDSPQQASKFGWKAKVYELLGQVIDDKYEILDMIGTGGMGSVYKGLSLHSKENVALKVLLPHLAHEGPSLRRFQLEAKAASRINHPNSVSVHDFGVWREQAYLVMDFLPGKSLSQFLKERGRLPIDLALPIFVQACAGLAAAHALGIYHRDVKPSNFMVLISTEGIQTKVCDFGLAKLKISEGDTITGTGEVFGSPPYMSPEQCLGQAIDERSDIYSMGCLMYECLTGTVPIKGNNPLDTMRKQVTVAPSPLKLELADENIYQGINNLVKRALAKEPEARQQSMLELKADLEAVLQDKVDFESRENHLRSKPAIRFFDRLKRQVKNDSPD